MSPINKDNIIKVLSIYVDLEPMYQHVQGVLEKLIPDVKREYAVHITRMLVYMIDNFDIRIDTLRDELSEIYFTQDTAILEYVVEEFGQEVLDNPEAEQLLIGSIYETYKYLIEALCEAGIVVPEDAPYPYRAFVNIEDTNNGVIFEIYKLKEHYTWSMVTQ